jgi:ketosteroid isomerase-like protein
MSQERVERVRAGYEAFNRGDVDSALEGFHPDVEWSVLGILPDPEHYRGHAAVRRFWRTWQETFAGFQIEVEELIDAGDRVVVLIAASGRGSGSGAPVRTPTFGQVWTFDGELVTRVEMLTEPEARDAVGLRE